MSHRAEIAELLPLARAVLASGAELNGEAALALAAALGSALPLLVSLDAHLAKSSPTSLLNRVVDLPLRLALAGKHAQALDVAEAFRFVSPDDLDGDAAVILALSGQREAALARVAQNLSQAKSASVAEAKAGDVYRALGEDDAAEAYYRRSLAEAKAGERNTAIMRIVSLLVDSGRDADAQAFIEQQGRPAPVIPAVGRNEPCPCGSGKKYKKCHGSSA